MKKLFKFLFRKKAGTTQVTKCCLCGCEIKNKYDNHNPYPVRPETYPGEAEGRCCANCNENIVIPYRIKYGYDERVLHKVKDMSVEQLMEFLEREQPVE